MPLKRNLVIILTRGLRSDVLSDSRAWPTTMPNMDRLCERGLRLVAHSACPAADGGLVSLLTGLHARQHGHVDTTRNLTCAGWPALLQAQGYHLTGVGCVGPIARWLHDAVHVEDVHVVESDRCAYLRAMHVRYQLAAIQLQRRQRLRTGPFEPDRLILEPNDDIDGFIAAEAEKKLIELNSHRPWAIIVMFSGPGNDLPPPTLYDQIVEPRELEAGFVPADLTRLDALAELDYPRVMLQRLDPIHLARIRGDYLGRVSLIDHGIGRLWRALEERPDRELTWAVVASDRGQLLGEHGLIGHRSFLTGAIETPLLLLPPTPAPRISGDGLVSTVDIAATIALLGGCDLGHAVTGQSLLPLLTGETLKSPAAGACLSEFGRRLMLMTDRYKVVFDTETRTALGLYDLAKDADERRNLLEQPTGRNILDALRWRLAETLLPLRAEAAG